MGSWIYGFTDLQINGIMDLRKMLDGESGSGTTIVEMAKRKILPDLTVTCR